MSQNITFSLLQSIFVHHIVPKVSFQRQKYVKYTYKPLLTENNLHVLTWAARTLFEGNSSGLTWNIASISIWKKNQKLGPIELSW